jgi:citrate lyase subunit beta/citryl-CoA lyase
VTRRASPLWRSLLYVPANRPRFIDKAHSRGADAVILDLEDSVPARERDAARAALPASIEQAGASGADVLVRVNSTGGDLESDLSALASCLPRALILPKVECAEQVARVDGWLAMHEVGEGVGLFALIETARGLRNVDAIARCNPRLLAITLGGEDFAADVGMEVLPETLDLPRQIVLHAARAAGLIALGLMGSIADFSDLDAVDQVARRSRRFGFEGASCLHPSVVPILNRAFSPSESEVRRAQRIVDAYEEACARGVGSIIVDGRMVDVPIAQRARMLLTRHARITEHAAR